MTSNLEQPRNHQVAKTTACGLANQKVSRDAKPLRSGALLAARTIITTTIFVLLSPLAATAQPLPQDEATIVTLSGKPATGSLSALSAENLTIAGDTAQQFILDELISVQFQRRAASKGQTGAMVYLAGGDQLSLQPTTIGEDDLIGNWNSFPAWPPTKIPLEQIQAIAFQRPQDARTQHQMTANLLELNDKRDTVILRNGDRLGGRLLQLANDSLTFEGPVGKLTLPRQDILAMAFSSELISTPKAGGRLVLLELSDGSRLTARSTLLIEQGLFEVATRFGSTMKIPVSAVVSLRFLGRRAIYLSDLNAAEYHYTPYLNDRWPLRRDRNVNAGPLRLNGNEYAKGLGMHSQSTVSYTLDSDYRQFRATVGIDDSAGKKGSVRFAVQLDGKPVYRSQLVTGADKPVDIGPINVTGKKQLTLIVEFGDQGDILDHANWCNAILVR